MKELLDAIVDGGPLVKLAAVLLLTGLSMAAMFLILAGFAGVLMLLS